MGLSDFSLDDKVQRTAMQSLVRCTCFTNGEWIYAHGGIDREKT
jgi:hypothetical protein